MNAVSRGLAALVLGLLLLTPGCEENNTGSDGSPGVDLPPGSDGAPDGGPPPDGPDLDGPGTTDGDGPPHNLDKLEVHGLVTLQFAMGSPATGVAVTGRCGTKEVSTTTNDEGEYGFVADVKGCAPLVIEFNKESYLPNYRILHLPPPTSPVTVSVPLAALSKLQCGTHRCLVEDNYNWHLPPDPMRQGWATTMAGVNALPFYGGEFRQADGKLVGLVGFAYFDFRDASGAYLDQLQGDDAFGTCVPVPDEALDWLGDVDLGTDDVEMRWYGLDVSTGRWTQRATAAEVAVTKGNLYTLNSEGFCIEETNDEGLPIRNIVPVKRSELPDVRAHQLTFINDCSPDPQKVYEVWVCGWVDGSGWFAWGVDLPERTCFTLDVTNQCGDPIPNVVFSLKGRDHGYRAEAWTDYTGKACLDVIPSEPQGKDYDADGLGGETFWVDIDLSSSSAQQQSILSHKNPVSDAAAPASCNDPSSCIELIQEFNDFNTVCK